MGRRINRLRVSVWSCRSTYDVPVLSSLSGLLSGAYEAAGEDYDCRCSFPKEDHLLGNR